MLRQRVRNGFYETLAQTSLANFQHRFEQLRGGLEFADLRIGQWFKHGVRRLNYLPGDHEEFSSSWIPGF